MNPVLGVNFGTHDAAAAVTWNGKVIAAAEEERFTRTKHTKAFPHNAIRFCLDSAGVEAGDLDAVALFVDPKLQALLAVSNLRHAFPASLGALGSDLAKYVSRRRLPATIRTVGGIPSHVPLVTVPHHRAHAASAYLTSPFDEALVVTLDGRGEYETACVFAGDNQDLRRLHQTTYPHSFGYLYSALTRYLGFRPQRDEYKVMGLAAHGTPELLPAMRQLARISDRTGTIELDLGYFDHHRKPSKSRSLYSPRLVNLLGPPRSPNDDLTDRHRDVAHAVQVLLEELVLAHLRWIARRYPRRALCLAGGVALNCVVNGRIIESELFDRIHIQPAAGDPGTSIGAALATAPGERRPQTHAFLGPRYTEQEVRRAIDTELPSGGFDVVQTADPHGAAAELLEREQIIGWFAGRMEFGPRALGARSILASPRQAETTSRINAIIKRREAFRPLAPAVLAEHVHTYFYVCDAGALVYPFMLATAQATIRTAAQAPAVVHIDGSARVQTVSPNDDQGLYRVIQAFHKRTGLPMLLNTSFNLADEPIVCTPVDAIRTLARSTLDALVIGNYVITRRHSALT